MCMRLFDKVNELRAADPAFDKDYKTLALMLQAG